MYEPRLHTSTIFRSALTLTAALSLSISAQTPTNRPTSGAPTATTASLAGTYDGGQMEVGAQLLLKPNGHFQYELAYGSLDESGEGTWSFKDGAVYLTSVPAIVPPRFVVVSDTPDPRGGIHVTLTKPVIEGMRQRVLLIYGTSRDADEAEVNDDGSVEIPAGKHPTAFIPEIPVYPTQPDPIPLKGAGGHRFVLRFEAHDIGKADFRAQQLVLDNGVLVMRRPDLQLLLHFRRQQ